MNADVNNKPIITSAQIYSKREYFVYAFVTIGLLFTSSPNLSWILNIKV